jgi:cation diffusion facilitator CzcD-associated flavoprotein CzcO
LDASVTQLHSADYRNPQALPEGPVLVVGGGNSGFQIAEELAATRTVDLSIATTYPMLPQRLAGRDLFWWLTRLGLMRVTVNSRPGQRMSRRDFVIGTNRRRAAVRLWSRAAGAAFSSRSRRGAQIPRRAVQFRLMSVLEVVAEELRPSPRWATTTRATRSQDR